MIAYCPYSIVVVVAVVAVVAVVVVAVVASVAVVAVVPADDDSDVWRRCLCGPYYCCT